MTFTETDLPEGWLQTTLDKLLWTLESGTRPRGGVRNITEGKPSIGGEHLSNEGGFQFNSIKYIPDDFYKNMSRGHIQIGDILVVKDGATTGKVSLVRSDFPFPDAVVNEHVFICRPAEGVLPSFLFWFLFSKDGQERILENFQGSAQGGINQSFAANTVVPLVPCSEQTRIVVKVESLLERVNTARARLVKLPAILKCFRQSVLAAAFSGQLTAEWRKNHLSDSTSDDVFQEVTNARMNRFKSNNKRGLNRCSTRALPLVISQSEPSDPELPAIPKGWSWVSCGELCQPERALTYGIIKLGHDVDDGVPVLRSSDVRWLRMEENHVKKISPRIAAEFSRTFLHGGEILVTVRGSLGGVVVVPSHMKGYNISREVAVIPIEPALDPRYIAFSIAATWSQNWLSGVTKGAAYTGINIEDLKRLPLPIPSFDEQREIVRCVEALFSLTDKIDEDVRLASGRTERVSQTILARAFRGELVPTEAELAAKEGRDYESASTLLEKITQSRKLHPRIKRGRKPKSKDHAKMVARNSVSPKPIDLILQEHENPMTPERLFELAGYDTDTVDEFYDQLRRMIQGGKVRENRPNEKDVTLEAVGS